MPIWSPWMYDTVVLASQLSPDECRARLRAVVKVVGLRAVVVPPQPGRTAQARIAGDDFTLALDTAWERRFVAAVVAEGTIRGAPNGSWIAVRIGQDWKAMAPVFLLTGVWLVGTVAVLVGFLRTGSLAQSPGALIIALVFSVMPVIAYRVLTERSDPAEGAALLQFLMETLNASPVDEIERRTEHPGRDEA